MIQPGSYIKTSDNSGAKIVQCLKIIKKSGRSLGYIGDFAIVSVKELRYKGNRRVKKKELCIALIIQTPRKLKRNDGRFLRFLQHKCIILNRKYKILGTRIFGVLSKELRKKKMVKMLSLTSKII